MIETIYNEKKETNINPDVTIRLPKNIKQIGQGDANMNYQIYIEENVLFYIKQLPDIEDSLKYGVLLGEKKQGNGYTYIFVNGVIEVDNIIDNAIIFSDDVWTGIYDNLKRYYRKSDIVGWFASSQIDLTKDIHSIKKIHLDHFAGNGKVYLNIIREESEEAFYVYERNGLRKQACYHVYFEKTVEFEDYLFGTGYMGDNIEEKKEIKETGKYGIAINNAKQEKIEVKTLRYGRVASFAAILVLSGIVYYMGSNGQLDSLSGKMQGLVGGIVDRKELGKEDILSVNGNITSTVEESRSESVSQNITVEEQTSEKITVQEATSQKETKQEVTKQEETTVETQATISIPNENYEVYIVKAGDTLYGIAISCYGSADKIKEIIELNKLTDEDFVVEGQKILLP